MAFVNPNILQKLFAGTPIAQQGAFDPNTDQGRNMIAMLAGAGSGMTEAAAQPGANFSRSLGGGAAGMMQGQQQAQQMQMNQMQMDQLRREQERQERISKIMGGMFNAQPAVNFAERTGAQLPSTPQLAPAGPAQTTPYQAPGAMTVRSESGGGGVGTVSTGQGDPGGQSYGTHQLSSNAGTMAKFLASPEGQPFANHFSGQAPGSPAFNASYQQVVQGAGPQFEQAQKQYLERTHVAPVIELAAKAGLPVDNPAIQEALYSQAIQHSGDGNAQIINETMARLGSDSRPEDILDTLYQTRERYAVDALERKDASPEVIQGVRNRYQQERQQTLGMLGERDARTQAFDAPAQQPQQPQMNGYEQAGMKRRANDPMAGIPPQARRLLAMMAEVNPEGAMETLLKMQAGGDTPARIQEAQMIAQQTGEPVGIVLARMRDIMPGGDDGLTTANRTREQEIQALLANDPDADEQAVRNAVYGRYKVSRDPISGRADVIDIVTGQPVTGIRPETVDQANGDQALVSTIVPEGMDISPAMGGSGFLANIVNTGADMVGAGALFPDAEAAAQAVNNLKTQTMTALAQEVAGRPSNYLLEQFERIAPTPNSLLQGDARSREKLRTTSALIDEKLRMVNDVVDNPGSYRPATVDSARQNKLQLEALKRQYDTAYENFGAGGQQSGQADPEVDELINRWAD